MVTLLLQLSSIPLKICPCFHQLFYLVHLCILEPSTINCQRKRGKSERRTAPIREVRFERTVPCPGAVAAVRSLRVQSGDANRALVNRSRALLSQPQTVGHCQEASDLLLKSSSSGSSGKLSSDDTRGQQWERVPANVHRPVWFTVVPKIHDWLPKTNGSGLET